jgi:hypothetical protein
LNPRLPVLRATSVVSNGEDNDAVLMWAIDDRERKILDEHAARAA